VSKQKVIFCCGPVPVFAPATGGPAPVTDTVSTASKRQQKSMKKPRELQLPAVIRCSECGGDFGSDRAFKDHDCEQQPFNFDYAVGSNL
jgi:hypothetical protein